MSDFRDRRMPIEGELAEPPLRISTDSDADGYSDVEELFAGTDPNDTNNFPGPVLETSLPPLGGVEAVDASVEALVLEPEIAVATATPTGSPITTATIGGITVDSPDHDGIDLDEGGLGRPSALADAMGFGGVSVSTSTGTYGGGSLGPLPGTGLVAADGDGTSTTANPDGTTTTTTIVTTSNEEGTTKTTTKTTDGDGSRVVTTTVETTESDGDRVTIVKTDTYKGSDDGRWVKESGTVTATGTNGGEPFAWRKQTYPPDDAYDTGEGDAGLPEELSPIVQQLIEGGGDPTTTTPSGPTVDDGGGEPVTADDVSGATTMLGIRVNPGVTDGGFEMEVVADGAPGGGLVAGGPDMVDPFDPTIGGGGEPVSAGDLSGPQPTNANPTSSTSSAMRAEGYTGGEDEDLDDLELQFSTARESTSPWTPVGEAGSVGTIHEVAEPAEADGPVLDAVLADPPVIAGATGLPGLDPEVAVATTTPDGLPVDAGIEGFAIGDQRIDTTPSHYGIDTSVGGVTPTTVTEMVDVATTATGIVTPATGGTTGTGSLGPLPGTDLYGSSEESGDDAVAGGKQLPPYVPPSERQKPPEKGLWDTIKDMFDPAGGSTTTPDAGTKTPPPGPNTPLKPYPGQKLDNPDADPVLATPSDVVTQIVTTGVDPTTTTPSGPYVDDAAPEPVTSDDLAGAGPVGGLHVPVNPLVTDGTGEPELVVAGDLRVPILAEGPDVVDPNDPVLGGAEPITAGDLTPRPGVANPIAGGEDEDLEDLEIQRITTGPTPTPTTSFADDTTAQISQPLSASADSLLAPVETAAPAGPMAPAGRGQGGGRGPQLDSRGRGHDEVVAPEPVLTEPVVQEPAIEEPVFEETHGDPVELFGDDMELLEGAPDGGMPGDGMGDWDG